METGYEPSGGIQLVSSLADIDSLVSRMAAEEEEEMAVEG